MPLEVWTVADDEVVADDGREVIALTGLAPGTEVEVPGIGPVRTQGRPPGERLATICTVNDVHIGELECGKIEEIPDLGPVLVVEDGEPPYAEMMSAAACAGIAEVVERGGVEWAVVAKGDLTAGGRQEEYDAFLALYEGRFGERMHHVRGNHDAMAGLAYAAGPQAIELPGVVVALLDTVVPGKGHGWLEADQLAWLDEVARQAEVDGRHVLVMGHHHPWAPDSDSRPDTYFGILPDASEALVEVVARRRAILGVFSGHTHRNRVRRFAATGDVPFVEVASTKDFPGTWAEYRVFEGGVLQVHRRVATASALDWSERCRAMIAGLYAGYAAGSPSDRDFAMWPRAAAG